MLNPPERREIRQLGRRVRVALFLQGLTSGTALLLIVVATALLAVRLVGSVDLILALRPQPWWLAGLALPLGGAIWLASSRAAADGLLHEWLDRNLELRGLLITEQEVDAGAWAPRIDAGLARAREVRPALPARTWVRRLLPAALFLGVVLWLPAPERVVRATSVIKQHAVEELEEKLEHLVDNGVLTEERAQELAARVKELREDLANGEEIDWSDVDALDAKLAQEQARHAAELEKTKAALAEFAQNADAKGAEARAELADLLTKAAESGVLAELAKLPELPEEVRKMLEKLGLGAGADATGALDAAALPATPEALAELAKALAEAAGGELGKLAAAGMIDPSQLSDLGELVAGLDPLVDPGHVHDPG